MMIWFWKRQINGSARAIVTFNQRHFASEIKGFSCAVILPATALQQMRSVIHETEQFRIATTTPLLEELRKAAELEGVALNQLINVAVAEKVSALRTEEYFREKGSQG